MGRRCVEWDEGWAGWDEGELDGMKVGWMG